MPEQSNGVVHLVVQRYRSCKVLLEEKKWIEVGYGDVDMGGGSGDGNAVVGKVEDMETNTAVSSSSLDSPLTQQQRQQQHCGLLVYVSFASTADKAKVEQAVTTLLNLPVLTTGLWGDGVSTVSLLQLLSSSSSAATIERETQTIESDENNNNPCLAAAVASVAIIPQANLICKVKGQGKSIQYHGQIEKVAGQVLYNYFCDYLRGAILEHQFSCRKNNSLPDWYCEWKKEHSNSSSAGASSGGPPYDPSISPNQLFRDPSRYAAWDDATGLPTADAGGQPLTKSALKKLRKLHESHQKKHLKWKEKKQKQQEAGAIGGAEQADVAVTAKTENLTIEEGTAAAQPQPQGPSEDQWAASLDPSFCQIVAGSFGMRQGLEIRSNMGPFCHLMKV